MTHYIFWTVFPSIRSSRLYIQQQAFVKHTCCCTDSLELLMMDEKTVRNMFRENLWAHLQGPSSIRRLLDA